jgi:hypothetical protein
MRASQLIRVLGGRYYRLQQGADRWMTTRLQHRLVLAYIRGFTVLGWIVGAFMVFASRKSDLTLPGHLLVVSLVGSAAMFPICLLTFAKRGYEADMTHGINFFSLAFGPRPEDPLESAAWVAARWAVVGWLGIAASMALLATVETLAGIGARHECRAAQRRDAADKRRL